MKKILYGICFLSLVVLIGACFSPWRGEENGNLSIVWGNTENSGGRLIHDLVDPDLTGYKVILKGPDGKQQEYDFSGVPGASFSVAPGTWNVTVKGGTEYRNDYPGEEDGELEIKILGMSQIEVKAGEKTTENIDMYNMMEVFGWSDLDDLINSNYGYCTDPECNITRHEIIYVLKSEDPLQSCEYVVDNTLSVFFPVIIVADGDIILKRYNDPDSGERFNDPFFSLSERESRLTLGLPGMNGRITIDGYLEDSSSNPVTTKEAILAENYSTLVMNEGVSIIGNNTNYIDYYGGAVYVDGSTFNMNGGTISGNKAYVSGGGVYITGSYPVGGAFNMAGGTISGNEAINGYGGGVSVDFGTFNMTGGTISGNTANGGGGVLILDSEIGKFLKTGNSVIYGSDAPEALRNTALLKNDGITSKGHAVYMYSYSSLGETPMKIRNTTAGAGVNLDTDSNSGWD